MDAQAFYGSKELDWAVRPSAADSEGEEGD